MFLGYWKWLPVDQATLRARACGLNGSQPADSLPPKYKTTADMRAAAIEGDHNLAQGAFYLLAKVSLLQFLHATGCSTQAEESNAVYVIAGIPHNHERHSSKQTGVHGSHPFYKLVYFKEEVSAPHSA